MERPSWAPQDVNLAVPSVARMYDYYLGGLHNFEVDRQMADQGAAVWPDLPQIMRENRAFLGRAVRHLVTTGIRQYLDIGSGIPTAGNVHEIAHAVDPGCRVVYVDIDPVAVSHSHALLTDTPNSTAIHGDFRDIDRVLTDPATTDLIDLTEPVAVLLVALLHFIGDDADPGATIARIRDLIAPGSYLVLSHFSNEGDPDQVQQLLALSRSTPTPLTLRSRAEVTRFFEGFDLIDPGVVYLPQWRPDDPGDVDPHPERFNDFCAVARKP
jgi:hypothetical protein